MKFFRVAIFIILAALVYLIYQFYYLKPAFAIGESIPDFKGTTIDDRPFSIDEMRGKLVLVEFWGTWCGPCRKQMPQLSSLYRTYRDSLHGTFEIVTIAMDDDTAALRRVINQDSLVWPIHLRESKQGGTIANLFEIREIPTSYLINEKAQIIRVNPSIDELRAILEKVDEAHYSKIRKQAG